MGAGLKDKMVGAEAALGDGNGLGNGGSWCERLVCWCGGGTLVAGNECVGGERG
ncbi:hypothetical protein ABE504_11875 [Paenibacillus oryzisoli]|uniref:hypothetical protein n=1 Tax=Paenibacillus oryzisoli TaxID=1850517 RepID=UPI003D2C5944